MDSVLAHGSRAHHYWLVLGPPVAEIKDGSVAPHFAEREQEFGES